KPDDYFILPPKLKEISGITFYRKNKLACVQDEKGKIYIYNIKKNELKETVDFGENHDYEGIANVNDSLYVLQSNGKIYEVRGFETDSQKTIEHTTFLTKENNAEGICFDKKNNRLLIACKGAAGSDSTLINKKAIYAFDLVTNKLSAQPVYTIDLDSIRSYVEKLSPSKSFTESIKEKTDPAKGEESFQPSEIAIHPITHEIYIIASVGKLLIVLNTEGKIIEMDDLDPEIFKQPEGITFDELGNMYISDEGKNGKANILRFNFNQ
ncbi:MAG: SdiA-regulated domain-containing protein, partial [Bacteroidota bacterium]